MENAVFGQNVNGNEVKEEIAMNTTENVQENVNVANEEEKAMNEEVKAVDNHEGKVKRFCTECGSVMWLDSSSSRQTICPTCREAKKKAQAEKAHIAAQKRKAELGLVTMNVSMYESTKVILKAKSKEKGMSIADFLKELLEDSAEPIKQENEIA